MPWQGTKPDKTGQIRTFQVVQLPAPRRGLYNPETGQFDVENKGVPPDIEVDSTLLPGGKDTIRSSKGRFPLPLTI